MGAVLDNETGKLLKYHHLIKRPKINKFGATTLGMRLEYYHDEFQAGIPAPTQYSSLTKVTFQMNNGNMSATAGSFATSTHRTKESIKHGSHMEAATYKLT